MDGSKKNTIRLVIGILISALCIYLAFRKVEIEKMWLALKEANYWYLVPAAAAIFSATFSVHSGGVICLHQ